MKSAMLILLLLLAACREEPAERGTAAPETGSPAASSAGCRAETFEGSAFTICTLDPATDEFRLVWRDKGGRPLRNFDAVEATLGSDAARVRFAMNAGMYDEEGGPVGLYVENGRKLHPINLRKGPGNFHLLPNGVFAIDSAGRPSVTASHLFRTRVQHPLWATQSGPMLVIDGKLHPRFDYDGPSRLIRNGVGVRDRRRVYFAISEEGVSFGRFARLFRDRLGCANALFLDGSVSSLWDPGAERKDHMVELGPMLVVLKTRRKGHEP